jgi:hypothetical protein
MVGISDIYPTIEQRTCLALVHTHAEGLEAERQGHGLGRYKYRITYLRGRMCRPTVGIYTIGSLTPQGKIPGSAAARPCRHKAYFAHL